MEIGRIYIELCVLWNKHCEEEIPTNKQTKTHCFPFVFFLYSKNLRLLGKLEKIRKN